MKRDKILQKQCGTAHSCTQKMLLFVCISLTLTGGMFMKSWTTGCQRQKVNRKWQQCHFLLSPCKSLEDRGKCQLYIAAEKKVLFIKCRFAAAAAPTNLAAAHQLQLIFPVDLSLPPAVRISCQNMGFWTKYVDMYTCTKTVAYK